MSETVRIAVGIEYDGSQFHGWQFQTHEPQTVQQVVEYALGKVANHPVRVSCAGRTDTGVHAVQQVVHFDTHAIRDARAWVLGGNRWLPNAVSLQWAKQVDPDFHARFSAQDRSYRYLLYQSPVRQALLNRQLTWTHKSLNLQHMQLAAKDLLGYHDFSSFRAVACQAKQPCRTIHHISLSQRGSLIILDIKADGFLQHMVRNIMGVLLAIGEGSRPVSWVAELLACKDRTLGGVTAPAFGLYFLGPSYDPRFEIPLRASPIPVMPIDP